MVIMEDIFEDSFQVSPSTANEEAEEEDCDAIDPDIECQLYSSIYHQPNQDHDHVSNSQNLAPGSLVQLEKVDENLNLKEPSPISHAELPPKSPKKEIVFIEIDSEEELSKTDLIARNSSRARQSFNQVYTLSSDSDTEEEYPVDVDFSQAFCSNILVNGEVDPLPIDAANKSVELKSSATENKALSAFLEKCKPGYSQLSSSEGKSNKRKAHPEATPKTVSLELLNSLPGSSNRFKKIKLDKGEDASLWKINSQDLVSPFARRNRYYRESKCNHCKEFTNHETRDCPFPRPQSVCFLCSEEGHKGEWCPNVICRKCKGTGHPSHMCSTEVWKLECIECGLYGHVYEHCPNHWRRYSIYSTKKVEDGGKNIVNPSQRNKRVFCCNCVQKGHFYFECRLKSDISHNLPTSPFLNTSDKMKNKIRNSPKGSKHRSPYAAPSSTFTPMSVVQSPFSVNSTPNHRTYYPSQASTFTPMSVVESSFSVDPQNCLNLSGTSTFIPGLSWMPPDMIGDQWSPQLDINCLPNERGSSKKKKKEGKKKVADPKTTKSTANAVSKWRKFKSKSKKKAAASTAKNNVSNNKKPPGKSAVKTSLTNKQTLRKLGLVNYPGLSNGSAKKQQKPFFSLKKEHQSPQKGKRVHVKLESI